MLLKHNNKSLSAVFIRTIGFLSIAFGLLLWYFPLTSPHNLRLYFFPHDPLAYFWESSIILAGFSLICTTLNPGRYIKLFIKGAGVFIIINSLLLCISKMQEHQIDTLSLTDLPHSFFQTSMIAFVQILLGIGFIIVDRKNFAISNYFQYCILSGILITAGSLAGNFFGYFEFYFQILTPLSFIFLLLFISLLISKPDLEFNKTLLNNNKLGKTARKSFLLSTLLPIMLGWSIIKARDAGLFSSSLELPLFGIGLIFIQAMLVLFNASLLQRFSLHKNRTEKILKEREATINSIIKTNEAGFYEFSLTENKGFVNKRWAEMIGYSLESIPPISQVNSWLHSHIHPDYLTNTLNAYQDFITGKTEDFNATFLIRHKTGEWLWQKDYCRAVKRDHLGNATFISGLRVDITEKKKLENSLSESEERFESLANNTPVLIWMANVDKRCVFFNKTWLKFTGRTLQQDFGFGWTECIHVEDLQRYLGIYYSSFDTRKEYEVEIRLKRFDGNFRWVLIKANPRHLPDGTFMGYIGTCIDITKLKQAVDALRESEERYQNLFEFSPCAIFIHNKGKIIFANRQTAKLFKEDNPSSLIGKRVSDYYDPIEPATSKSSTPPAFEDIIIQSDGTVIEIEAIQIPFNYNGLSGTQVLAQAKYVYNSNSQI